MISSKIASTVRDLMDGLKSLWMEFWLRSCGRYLVQDVKATLEMKLSERDQIEGDLRRRLDEAKQHEEDLENELAKMWVLVAKFRKLSNCDDDVADHVSENSHARFRNVFLSSNGHCNVSKNDESCKSMNKTGVIHV